MIATVPFEMAGGGQPLIVFEAKVNDSGPFRFLLDTGAGSTLVTANLAAKLGVATLRQGKGQGIGGSTSIGIAAATSIQIGELRKENVEVGVTESLDQVGRAIGTPVDGLLGHTFFNDLSLTIDFEKRRLTFATADENVMDVSTGTPFELVHAKKPLIQVDVWINGSGPYPMALDTGASSTSISPELARFAENVHDIPGGVSGIGGRVPAQSGRLRSLRVGDSIQRDSDVVILDTLGPLNQALGKELMGLIGFNFLRHYRVTIDYPRQKIMLIPVR